MQTSAVIDLPAWSYFTYPHTNGFTPDGSRFVVGRIADGRNDLWLHDTATGTAVRWLYAVPASEARHCRWYDIATRAGMLVLIDGDAIVAIDLERPAIPRPAWRVPAGWRLQELPSISADGRRVALALHGADGRTEVVEVDLATGALERIADARWHLTHVHYCPADEGWIGFAHEGHCRAIADRMWAAHRRAAPGGRCVFDQRLHGDGAPLAVGHERWCTHDISAVVCAYGEGDGAPRGLYEVFADGRRARLVSGSDRHWHCNVSRDGTLAVVDTTGAHDAPGRGWENADGHSDIVLVDMASGQRRHLWRTGRLWRRYEGPQGHPFHPHPHLTPRGDAVVFNDYREVDGCVVPAVRLVRFDRSRW